MNKIFAGRIFADYSQFRIYDSGSNAIGALPDWNEGDNAEKGYMMNVSAISMFVYGGTFEYWLEVYLSDDLPGFNDVDRVLAFNLNIASGKLIISNIFNSSRDEGVINLFVEAGSYIVYIFGYNLIRGNDVYDELFDESFDELSEEEKDRVIESETDMERYKIILIPGKTESEGIIKGEKYNREINP
jgi:hypothetical protein